MPRKYGISRFVKMLTERSITYHYWPAAIVTIIIRSLYANHYLSLLLDLTLTQTLTLDLIL